MRLIIIIAIAVLPGGCGQETGVVRQGMWETTVTMAAGKSELWRSTAARCMYDEEAANPGSGLIKVGQLNHCATSQSDFSGGKFVVRATCPERQSMQASVPMTPDWLASRVELSGNYTPTSIDGRISAELEDTIEPMKFSGEVHARRTGDC
jgi:hypothetical protein